MGSFAGGVLSGVASGVGDELKQRRKRKQEGSDALRNKQADELEQAMKNTQARGALQPTAPGYLKPEEVKQHIEDAQKQLTSLYEPEEAPLLFQRLKGIFSKQQPQQSGLELKPGMTLSDVLAGSGPAPVQSEPPPEDLNHKMKAVMDAYKTQFGQDMPSELKDRFFKHIAGGSPLEEKAVKTKGWKYDPATRQAYNQDTGERVGEGEAKDKDVDPEAKKVYEAGIGEELRKQEFALKLANTRGASYGMNRGFSVLDSANGNAPTIATLGDIKKNPGRYQPAGPASQALAQTNLMEDIKGVSAQARTAVNNLKEDFPPEMKLKLAVAMRSDDPNSAIRGLVSQGALGALEEDQQNFVIAMAQLAENAMAMRAVLKSGQGAEDMRDAIRATLPGLLSPDKSFAIRQLDAFDKTVKRLERGIPKVKLRETETPEEKGLTPEEQQLRDRLLR